ASPTGISPIGWHLGHIGHTEARWWLQDRETLAEFAVEATVKSARRNLPPLAELVTAVAQVRERAIAQPLAPRWAWWLLQHEAQHLETMAIVRQLQTPTEPLPLPQVAPREIRVEGGAVTVGSDAVGAQDNERPARAIALPPYVLSAPITKQEFAEFMAAGGYQRAEWWSPAGWAWQQQAHICQPLYWDALTPTQPVCGVSFYEAEAYSRFAGKRLPTEWEWEAAWHQGRSPRSGSGNGPPASLPRRRILRRFPTPDIRPPTLTGNTGCCGGRAGPRLSPVNSPAFAIGTCPTSAKFFAGFRCGHAAP
ncbi:MAG: SUMF1/EgtB/PvdO family nonheme iron enzyme, partial [Oscillatoriales cyanobacterium SM2_1_8]|nr:SUMF1/EgtB/PvdO family nonheme iron enzyme [Oscillatoriales cyanobacterium SM2_1_8]